MDKQTALIREVAKRREAFVPMGNYILIDLFKNRSHTDGGIELPDQVKDREKQMLATVISRGPGQRSIHNGEYLTPQIEPGDLVVIMKHAPIEIKVSGEIFYVIAEGDILAKITGTELAEIQEAAEVASEEKVLDENERARAVERKSGLIVVESKES